MAYHFSLVKMSSTFRQMEETVKMILYPSSLLLAMVSLSEIKVQMVSLGWYPFKKYFLGQK